MEAIIRHAKSGEHFLARIDEGGDATALSSALPTYEGRAEDHSNEIDWEVFRDADMEPWDDPADAWTADKFIVEHRFA